MKTGRWLIQVVVILALIAAGENYFLSSSAAVPTISKIPGHNVNTMSGIASYYSYECANQPMANGRPFDPEKRTCASWFHKFGTVLLVKSIDTGLTTEVIVTDRGPNKRLVKEGRIIDLSKRAFQDISPLSKGLTRVLVAKKQI